MIMVQVKITTLLKVLLAVVEKHSWVLSLILKYQSFGSSNQPKALALDNLEIRLDNQLYLTQELNRNVLCEGLVLSPPIPHLLTCVDLFAPYTYYFESCAEGQRILKIICGAGKWLVRLFFQSLSYLQASKMRSVTALCQWFVFDWTSLSVLQELWVHISFHLVFDPWRILLSSSDLHPTDFTSAPSSSMPFLPQL